MRSDRGKENNYLINTIEDDGNSEQNGLVN